MHHTHTHTQHTICRIYNTTRDDAHTCMQRLVGCCQSHTHYDSLNRDIKRKLFVAWLCTLSTSRRWIRRFATTGCVLSVFFLYLSMHPIVAAELTVEIWMRAKCAGRKKKYHFSYFRLMCNARYSFVAIVCVILMAEIVAFTGQILNFTQFVGISIGYMQHMHVCCRISVVSIHT